MATQRNKDILVYAHWEEFSLPQLVGVLRTALIRGKEVFSFEYNSNWLAMGKYRELDPDLGFYTGNQFVRDTKTNFGLFLDSSPDRWGRVLMDRREAILARIEDRKIQILLESDYLLGLYDETRMGALRFKIDEKGDFLNDNKALATPPWVNLRELEHASLELEKDVFSTDKEALKWLNMLLAPGSSLGGARPKASVRDEIGNLWIAKFPSRNDEYNTAAWEMLAYELALRCGIEMADSKIERFTGKHHTFLTKRFDRSLQGNRIHFASAMTLLGYTDGKDFHDGVSYIEIAEFITQYGAQPKQDLEQLWRRIVFSICIRNTDDHLRNHGFLLSTNGWKLSPAYDLNPNSRGVGLKLNISETDNSLNLDLAKEVIPYFRLSTKQATEIIDKTTDVVSKWKTIATKLAIPSSEQEYMKHAFEFE